MLVMDLNLEQHMSNEANVQIPKEKQAMEESQISATCVTLPLPGKEVSEIILKATWEKNQTNATCAILHPHVQVI